MELAQSLEPIPDWDGYGEDIIEQHYQVPKPRFKPRISAIELLDRKFYVCRSWPLNIPNIDHDEVPFQGTSFHGIVAWVRPKSLMAYLGSSELTDHYKVSQEFTLVAPPMNENDEWKTINIYDWKSTSLYDPECDSPGLFWEKTELEDLHLGHDGSNSHYAENLKLHLELNCGG